MEVRLDNIGISKIIEELRSDEYSGINKDSIKERIESFGSNEF